MQNKLDIYKWIGGYADRKLAAGLKKSCCVVWTWKEVDGKNKRYLKWRAAKT